MNHGRRVWLGTALALLFVGTSFGQNQHFYRITSGTTSVITALSPDGWLTWSNAAVGGTCTVEHATTLLGSNVWHTYVHLAVTGEVMSAQFNGPESYLVVDLSAGSSALSYPITYLPSVPPGGWTDAYKTTQMVFRRIPAGTFVMGSPTNELGRYSDETQHQVTLTQDFYIGVFEMTQKQWERVMGAWPSYFDNVSYRDARPVEQVNYNVVRGSSPAWPGYNNNVDANSFMGRLRARTGRAFDLPTESQWEYAGRAGTTTALNSGYNLSDLIDDARLVGVGRYYYNGGLGYSSRADTTAGTAKVGSYLMNQWGLYDIHGNVLEWCLDLYGTYPGTVTDPKGVSTGSTRVGRGGSWASGANYCRVAYRAETGSIFDAYTVGFRACLPPGE